MSRGSLVSIITPMYNAEAYILETINSVLSQSYANWEMLIVDNCSTDTSREIVKSIKDNRVKLIELDYNSGGPARPRNTGIEYASGNLMAFLDADDVWLPEKLSSQVEVMDKERADIVHTLAFQIDATGQHAGVFQNHRMYNILTCFLKKKNIIYYTNYININTVLMKTDKKSFFPEEERLVAVEDWAYWMNQCYQEKKVFLLQERHIKYRVSSVSMSSRNTDMGYRKALFLINAQLVTGQVPLRHYLASSFLNIGKLVIKSMSRHR